MKELSLLVLAGAACVIAYNTYKDTRSIEALDIKPKIVVEARFDKTGCGGLLIVNNEGPNEALQLEIDFIIQDYSEKLGKFVASTTIDSWHSEQRLLAAKNFATAEIPCQLKKEMEIRYKLKKKDPAEESGFIGIPLAEMRLSYRCLPDYRRYVESAVYFLNEEGRIVPEGNNSINKEPYLSMKSKIFNKIKRDLGYENMRHISYVDEFKFLLPDKLHLIAPEK